MLNKLSISQKTFGAFLTLSVVCLVVGALTIFNVFSTQSANRRNVELNGLLQSISDFQLDLAAHSKLGDNFMLSSQIRYKDQFREATPELETRFGQLAADFSAEYPEIAGDLRDARDVWLTYSRDWMGKQIEMMERLDSIDFARELESGGEGRRRFMEAETRINALREDIRGQVALAETRSSTASQWILIIACIGVAVTLAASIIMGLVYNAVVSAPLRKIADVTMELAGGRSDVVIPVHDAKDEIGDVSRALIVFQENFRRTAKLEAEQAELKSRSEAERRATMQQLAKAFEEDVMSAISEISNSVDTLKTASSKVTQAAETAGQRASDVASSTSETAGNVTAVAGATEEMSATIGEISSQVGQVATMAGEGELAGEDVKRRVSELAKSVTEIESVVRLIAEIAEQTNLLALNATIEAARAGDMGKGFAVVASEVKTLASQTAKATSDVANQIAAVRGSTSGVEKASQTVGSVISKLNDISSALAAAMGQQDSATREIANNVDSAASSANQVSANIAEVADIAQATGMAAAEIGREADALVERAAFVRSQSADFVKRLLAG